MKIAIITSICGNYEKLSAPTVVHENVDYYAFVDYIDSEVKVWNQSLAFQFSEDDKYANRRNAKIYKILPEMFVHGYDYYFWTDASHDVVGDPFEIVEKYLSDEKPYAVFKHTTRNCVYSEALLLKKLKYDHKNLINEEINFFKEEKYPGNNGLYELSAFVKKKTYRTTLASLKWWEIICRYSSRDQISFPFVLWKCGITPSILPGFVNGFNDKGGLGNNDLIPQTRNHKPSGV